MLLEIFAVIFAITYLILAVRQNILCWYAAFLSTAIYTFLYWDVSLYMESILNVYYLLMAIYGWANWNNKKDQIDLPIMEWSINKHFISILIILFFTLVSGFLLNNTEAARPYLDSFTTWGSVFTTYMVTQKILSNWLYWFVINGVGIFLNIDKELYLTALLLLSYQVISILGFINWRKSYYEQK
ncbi:MAG: nicotinamide riboside transporter PnuC [Rhizobiales bacterium TMED94]|nr:nicotinamide mononucleotide transporter [Rhodobiaceae bacterium]RPF88246.1 MAG: nicotinamide riboside transporter PnuC [Rhizobiales bacterium TMED94]|tara:strand:+ start:1996 stop:2550 length:555 start_codon:yes stop_codon:yes gene_type:complete